MNLIILTLTKKKIKKAAIYRPYNHLQASGFTFENKAEKETLDFIKQTYSSEASKYDFKTIYRDMTVMFIWKYGNNVDDLAEMYNDKLKKKRSLRLSDKQYILSEHYTSLKDTNEKVICCQDVYSKMNNKQKSYIVFIKDLIRADVVQVSANSWFYDARAKATDGTIRYSHLLRKFKIIDSQLAPLKQKYEDFGLV